MQPEVKEWLEHLEELVLTLAAIMPVDDYPVEAALRRYRMQMENL